MARSISSAESFPSFRCTHSGSYSTYSLGNRVTSAIRTYTTCPPPPLMEETPPQTGTMFLMHVKIVRKGFLSWDTFQVFEDTTLKHSGHTSLGSESVFLRDSSAPPPCQVEADPQGEVSRSVVKGADELPPGVWTESPQRPQGAFRHSLSVTLHSYLGIHSW